MANTQTPTQAPASKAPSSAAAKKQLPPWQSLLAGMIAGAVEGTITYPTEYVKTQLQLQSSAAKQGKLIPSAEPFKGPWDVAVRTVRERGFFALYRGLSALVVGNASKAGVRFLVFDQIKAMLADKDGKTTGARMVIAGLAAGVVEAVVAVTPAETIKTKLIHDQNQPNPRYRGLLHGSRVIFQESGIRGLYQGVTTVIARQGANSAVRMSAYGVLRERVLEFYRGGDGAKKVSLPWYTTFGIGAVAGTITVYSTMPLDVLKTRMQALDARQRYRNSADCLVKVVREDGVLALWKGATPRLGRLIFSGGIVFTVYEEVVRVFGLFN
ncbi:mitochondrial carrier domain-containing protein [Zopfochytrium polystomum]|nr:mitochondrial carrier domain-containing protein [Zopfochytrium polystomum]